MKQGTVKTLGAVALGAAIAATAAGTASAAPVGNSIDTNGVLHSLPVKDATRTISGATSNGGGGGVVPKAHMNSRGNAPLLGGLPAEAVKLPIR
ncbi:MULTISPECIES: hypothetical protein [unclassified Streptomyces]|uniref:hypothetical protein n=1 Tax=unclassified Streptomyces TaxID=2593676 RepID=UPI000378A11C|nr:MULTISPECIES: hypothetical protein [unclassified Streptomyces]MYT33353.1 hypothetical protein [Streptomyces sp. SID8354]